MTIGLAGGFVFKQEDGSGALLAFVPTDPPGETEDVPTPTLGTGQIYQVDGVAGDDANDGIPVAEGGTGPWKSPQHGMQQLVAGETLQIRGGIYSEPDPILGSSYWYGWRPKNSGTPGEPITIMAYPGETVVLDQGGVARQNGKGISLLGRSYINIIGIEIRDCWESGIHLHSGFGVENTEIYIHKCKIHNVRFTDGQNTAGLRLDFCNGVYVTDTEVYDIYTVGSGHHNAPAIMSYKGRNMFFQNNELYDCYAPIYQKENSFINPSKCFTFRRNLIHDVNFGFRTNNNAGTVAGQDMTQRYGYDALIEENIIYNLKASGYGTHDEAHYGWAQYYKWIFRNNTVVASPSAALQAGLYIRGWKEAEIYNNVFYENGGSGATTIFVYFDNNQLTGATNYFMPGLDYSNYNLFSSQPEFRIGTGSTASAVFSTLSSWQNVNYNSQPGLQGMTVAPDINSLVAMPVFMDSQNDDYRLHPSSSGVNIGRGGVWMGAQPTGAEVIGVRP